MAELIKEISDAVELLIDTVGKSFFLEDLKKSIGDNSGFNKMIELSDERAKGLRRIEFDEIFEEAFVYVADDVIFQMEKINDMSDISNQESILYDFIYKNRLGDEAFDTISVDKAAALNSIEEIFGDTFQEKLEKSKKIDKFLCIIKENGYNQDALIKKKDKIEFIVKGDMKFRPYLERNHKTYKGRLEEDSIVAILNDISMNDTDLIFTTSRVYVTGWLLIKDSADYKDVSVERKGEKLIVGGYKYWNHNIDMTNLNKMINLFAELVNETKQTSNQSLAGKIRYRIIDG